MTQVSTRCPCVFDDDRKALTVCHSDAPPATRHDRPGHGSDRTPAWYLHGVPDKGSVETNSRNRFQGYCGPRGPFAIKLQRSTASSDRAVNDRSPETDRGDPGAWEAIVADAAIIVRRSDGSFLACDGDFFPEPNGPGSWRDVFERFLSHGARSLEEIEIEGAVAGWNADTGQLTLLRDRYGVVPLYHTHVDGGLAFSSDVPSLLRMGITPTADLVALDEFIAYGYYPAPRSPIAGVVKIPPGHTVTFDADGATTRQWGWQDQSEPALDRAEADLLFRRTFEQALRRRWPSSGTAALLLSGGVDSAMILAGVARLLNETLDTYTFEYGDYDGIFNEAEHAERIAAHFHAHHERIVVGPDGLWNDLDRAVDAYGEPLTWGLHSYRLDPLRESGHSVLFSGAGPDGWGLSRRHRTALRFRRLPALARSGVRFGVKAATLFPIGQQSAAKWATRDVADLAELFSPDGDDNERLRASLYRDPDLASLGRHDALATLRRAVVDLAETSDERKLVLLDKRFTTAEQIVSWNTRWSRAHELALRLPYFDHDLVSLAMRLPGPRTGKDILRTMAAEWMPEEMAYAPKIPQQMPVSAWLRGPLARRATDRLASLPPAMADVFDQQSVNRLVRSHVARRADHGWLMIALLTTAAWFEQLQAMPTSHRP